MEGEWRKRKKKKETGSKIAIFFFHRAFFFFLLFLITTEKVIKITLQKMERALKEKEMVMTTTAIQARIKRTSEKTERSQERTSIILLEKTKSIQ